MTEKQNVNTLVKGQEADTLEESPQEIEICFWCGRPKDKNIELTDGDIENGKYVPRITSYIPCDDCKKIIGNNIHVIGVSKKPIIKDMFPISKDGEDFLYPTGSMFVAGDDFVMDVLSGDENKEIRENVLKERILLLPEEVVTDIIHKMRKDNKNNDKNVQSESNKESVD